MAVQTGSILLYIALLLLCVGSAYYAEKKDTLQIVLLSVLIISLVAGLRGDGVGLDTPTYNRIFELLMQGKIDAVHGAEVTFKYITRLFLLIFQSIPAVFFVYALLTNGLMILRLWDFRKRICFPVAIACYYAAFYFFTLNIMRQCVAIAIVFFATRYLEKNKIFVFLVGVLVASLFHQSALLGILYLLICYKGWRNLAMRMNLSKRKRRILYVTALLAVVFVLIWKASKYIHYFLEVSPHFGLLLPTKIVAVLLWATLTGRGRKKNTDAFLCQDIVKCYLLGLFLSLAGYFYPFMDRIGLYFTVCESIFLGYVYKEYDAKVIRTIVVLWIVVPFAIDVCSGGQGQLPYYFFWNS